MARVRQLEIQHFRSIEKLIWNPSPGINCLVGPGDSGKSTILDAIDLCLGARRTATFNDADFHRLDVSRPIQISITLGDLPDALMNLDSLGEYLRAFDDVTDVVEDEPRVGAETVVTVRMTVNGDLDPVWMFYSDRATQLGQERWVSWKERTALAPVRIGSFANTNLSWSRGSVLNRLVDETVDLGGALAAAARDARTQFGDAAIAPLAPTLKTVTENAKYLGVPIGASAQALLDPHSVSIGDGAIALHDAAGVPLRSLGTGSSRLLVAGLQRTAAKSATIALADEIEHGLEPHRLVSLLNTLGAKEPEPPLQVFMTSHSPVAVRELSGDQLFVTRSGAAGHDVRMAGTADHIQSTLRVAPEVFLAKSVVVCEGASEVGMVRGLDLFWSGQGSVSMLARGVSYVDVNGSSPDKSLERGQALLALGYRVLVFVDADLTATPELLATYIVAGGHLLTWRPGRALEDEIFLCLPDNAVSALLEVACERVGRELVEKHIVSKSNGTRTLQEIEVEGLLTGYSLPTRTLLGTASKAKGNAWFKSLTTYQAIACDIVGPHLGTADVGFQGIVQQLKAWIDAT